MTKKLKIPYPAKLWVVAKHLYGKGKNQKDFSHKSIDDLYDVLEKKMSKRAINKAFEEVLKEDCIDTIQGMWEE